MEFKLEKEFTEPFNTWKQSPTPQNATTMLTQLQPAIDRGIRAHVGKQVGPITRSQARKLTLKSLKTYDPVKSALSTHVINHLQGLKRIRRNQTQILKMPERVALDRGRLDEAAKALEDQTGYEPSLQELADFTGLSLKRIGYVRQYKSPLATGMLAPQVGAGGEVAGFSPAVKRDDDTIWLEVVYGDLTPFNQKIMEWTLGMHGKQILSNKEIAGKLRLTPGAISQRKATIQEMLNKQSELSPF